MGEVFSILNLSSVAYKIGLQQERVCVFCHVPAQATEQL
jgi:hypothetical protein